MRAALMAMAVWVATKQAEALRDIVFDVLGEGDRTDEQIADDLGVGRGQLAEQKRLTAHLSMWRFADLPHDKKVKILKRYLRSLGEVVIEDSALLGEYLELQVCRLKKRQLKMALATAQKAEVA